MQNTIKVSIKTFLNYFVNYIPLKLYSNERFYKKPKNKECEMFPTRETPLSKQLFLEVAGRMYQLETTVNL